MVIAAQGLGPASHVLSDSQEPGNSGNGAAQKRQVIERLESSLPAEPRIAGHWWATGLVGAVFE